MSQESQESDYVVQGPPGTGKTEYLKRLVERLCDLHGPQGIRIGSLTKTAAAAIRERVRDIPDGNVGTIHSQAYHQLGRPTLATKGEIVALWNEQNADLAIQATDNRDKDDDVAEFDDPGDKQASNLPGQKIYESYCLLRNRRTDRRGWPSKIVRFADLWEAFCDRYDVLDFTGFVERAIEEWQPQPHVRAVLVDEAQDLSTLENEYVQLFRAGTQKWVMCGDPDQALYDWRGADWSLFDTIEDKRRVVLHKSHRVPAAAHRRACGIIAQVSSRREAVYEPRSAEGMERVLPWGFRSGDLVESIRSAVAAGDSAMAIAPCAFMLDELIGELRARGVPFWNPYRLKNGRWNPLGAKKGVPMKDRIVAFLAGDWSRSEDARAWLKPLKNVVSHGLKKIIESPDWVPPTSSSGWRALFAQECHYERAMERNLRWWLEHLPIERQRVAAYPIRVFESFGIAGLKDNPRVTIGTIHSVKGGESDHVFVAPDLGSSFMQMLEYDPDPIHRMFYVACTRARQSLNLCMPMNRGMRVPYWL